MYQLEQVRKHLQDLGYDNVPADILQELAEELDESFLQNEPSTTTAASIQPASSLKQHTATATPSAAISKTQVLTQLKQLGYSEDDIPDDLVDELVAELETLLVNPSTDVAHPAVSRSPQTQYSPQKVPTSQPVRRDYQNVLKTVEKQRRNEQEIEIEPLEDKENSVANTTAQDYSIRHSRSQLKSQIANQRPKSSLSSNNSITRQSAPKKKDPVTIYHKYRKQWESDSFLQRLENPSAPQTKQKMFNGIGYYKLTHS